MDVRGVKLQLRFKPFQRPLRNQILIAVITTAAGTATWHKYVLLRVWI